MNTKITAYKNIYATEPHYLTIDEALNRIKIGKSKGLEQVIDLAQKIEGCARQIGVHACAVVVSPTTINDFSPTQTETGGDKTITQYEMHAAEDVGLIKFDILGIRNLSFLGQSVVNVRRIKKQ